MEFFKTVAVKVIAGSKNARCSRLGRNRILPLSRKLSVIVKNSSKHGFPIASAPDVEDTLSPVSGSRAGVRVSVHLNNFKIYPEWFWHKAGVECSVFRGGNLIVASRQPQNPCSALPCNRIVRAKTSQLSRKPPSRIAHSKNENKSILHFSGWAWRQRRSR